MRAQLIEAGHDVVAVDAWPVPRVYFQPDAKPRVVIVDLHELPQPQMVIDELPALAPPERTIVIASLATVPLDELRRRGFQVVARPATVGQIVSRVEETLSKRS